MKRRCSQLQHSSYRLDALHTGSEESTVTAAHTTEMDLIHTDIEVSTVTAAHTTEMDLIHADSEESTVTAAHTPEMDLMHTDSEVQQLQQHTQQRWTGCTLTVKSQQLQQLTH